MDIYDWLGNRRGYNTSRIDVDDELKDVVQRSQYRFASFAKEKGGVTDKEMRDRYLAILVRIAQHTELNIFFSDQASQTDMSKTLSSCPQT